MSRAIPSDSMTGPVDQDLRRIEQRESNLWYITLGLLILFGGTAAAIFLMILGEDRTTSEVMRSVGFRATGGFFILLFLFSAYVLHSRTTFGRVKRLLEKQALHDPLTGLFNRRYFDDRIEEEILRAKRNQSVMAVLLCDLDEFKHINDTRGHQIGDVALEEAAKAVKEATRGTDLVCRWGGDEIIVVLQNTTRDGALVAAERIRQGVHRISEEADLSLDISIGIALHPEHGDSRQELVRMADRALYIAKKGGDKIHIGEEEYSLDEDSVQVVFQAIVDTRTQEVLGYEALSRDPKGQLSILDLFKRYKAVGQLKELKCLCFKLQLKKAEELGLSRVFINVDFDVLRQIKPFPKPEGPEVILEISESEALNEVEHFLKIAAKWRAQGFKFAIDDFGAGFISLPFVAQLIPDYIKMDRSTILQAASSDQFCIFLKDLVQAFRNYTKEGIIAEGVENEKELRVAKETGNYLVQGFIHGKPRALNPQE